MIKVFEIILCMYLKTISPDVGEMMIMMYLFAWKARRVGYLLYQLTVFVLQWQHLPTKIACPIFFCLTLHFDLRIHGILTPSLSMVYWIPYPISDADYEIMRRICNIISEINDKLPEPSMSNSTNNAPSNGTSD
jgi:hypothetical protein